MKKSRLILVYLLALTMSATAESPEKISYQAVVRNTSNALITNHVIGMKISILQGSATGSVVYSELQTATSNANGLITIIIGNGMPVYCTFSCIDWTLGTYFIKTEIDPGGGTNYTISGTSQLRYVPFAVYAKTAEISKKTTPVGAVGQIQFSNGETLGGDPDLFWDKTQKRLGIGTSGAAAINSPLDVRSNTGNAIIGVSYDKGSGVMGYEYSSNGNPGIGVSGRSTSDGGIGVKGFSEVSSGTTYGVYGSVASPNGRGLTGICSSITGETVGCSGFVKSPDGFSGFFSGGKFYVNGKVGIGTETPGAGIHLKGVGYPDSFMFLDSNTGQDAGFRIHEGSIAKWHIFNDVNAGGLRMYNTNAVTAIFCKQSNSFVGINTITPAYNLEVNGTAGKTGGGSWSTSSDIRLKDVTGNYQKGLKEIVVLQPVSFLYKAGNARQLPTNLPQIGFVAQDVQKVFPEAVTKGEDGYLDFNIHAIHVALVNAVKELNEKNDRLTEENNQMKVRLEKIEKLLSEITKSEK